MPDPRDSIAVIDRQTAEVVEAGIRLMDEFDKLTPTYQDIFRSEWPDMAEAVQMVAEETRKLEDIRNRS